MGGTEGRERHKLFGMQFDSTNAYVACALCCNVWGMSWGLVDLCISSVVEIELAVMGDTQMVGDLPPLPSFPSLPFRCELPCLQLGGMPHHDLHAR